MNPNEKIYLGDGVYAQLENGMMKLTTTTPDNTIYLEPEVLDALINRYQSLVQYFEDQNGA